MKVEKNEIRKIWKCFKPGHIKQAQTEKAQWNVNKIIKITTYIGVTDSRKKRRNKK
jgi:hypothetical protein